MSRPCRSGALARLMEVVLFGAGRHLMLESCHSPMPGGGWADCGFRGCSSSPPQPPGAHLISAWGILALSGSGPCSWPLGFPAAHKPPGPQALVRPGLPSDEGSAVGEGSDLACPGMGLGGRQLLQDHGCRTGELGPAAGRAPFLPASCQSTAETAPEPRVEVVFFSQT